MQKLEKIEAYYMKEHTFKEAIGILRQLLKKTKLKETYKWNFPTYTIDHKNVLAICRFNHHFSLWFFHGVLLQDEHHVLENAQEGKTKTMRHWKFTSQKEINPKLVLSYIHEAIILQESGIKPITKPQLSSELIIPPLLKKALAERKLLQEGFNTLSRSKQKEYTIYISSAKQDKTKHARLAKIIPLILQGIGLNDRYR